ncbi:MAG: hypothetical protein H0Z33_16025 [Bacillaceae bacterium]|nr:hypothetical protein [Bacillaceae bacterium]
MKIVNKNNKYLLKLWIPSLIIIIVAFISLANNTNQNPTVLITVLFVIGLVIYMRFKAKNKINQSLKKESPESLIKTLNGSIKLSMGDIKAFMTAYHSALSYLLYGQFQQALAEMNKINWEEQEPLFQSFNLNIQSLNHYLNTKDYQEGLRLARKAKASASVSSVYPGQQKSAQTYQAYVDVGLILTNQASEEQIKNVQQVFNKLPVIPKLIIAWGLAVYYKNHNQMDKASEMINFCQQSAPYCRPLHETDVKIMNG